MDTTDANDTPMSLMTDGITIAFCFVPGGRSEVEAECRTALFIPSPEQGEDFEDVVLWVREKIEQAFRWGVDQVERHGMHPYDMTQPQVMAWLFQVVTLMVRSDSNVFVPVLACTPHEAAEHGLAVGRVLRVYASEGDTPAQWRVYRLLADLDGVPYLNLLERHTQDRREPVRKRYHKRAGTAKPRFSTEEQTALDDLRKGYDPKKMASDGASRPLN